MNATFARRTLGFSILVGLGYAAALQGCAGISSETCTDLLTCVDGGSSLGDGATPVTDGTMITPKDGASDAPPITADGDDGSTSMGDTGVDTGVDATPPCDPAKTPAQDGCVINDELAIFVAPSGNDTNAGTMEAPVKTLAHAVTLAVTASAHRVIACAATYSETLTLAAADDVGLQIFGGVTCPGGDAGTAWTYTGAKAAAKPTAHGYALSVSDLAHALDIEDFEFDAQNGTAAGESSIAGFVSGSSGGVTLERVTFVAGTAVTGTSGATPTTVLPVANPGTSGANGGGQVTCACSDSGLQSVGGAGGLNANGNPGLPNLGGGAGGNAALGCGVGGAGSDGNGATPPAPGGGAATLGSLTASGWTPTGGIAGSAGGPGQGGGGGGGAPSATGGGGACGGCGGAGASPGLGGGSSIALLVYQSEATLNSSVLTAKTAGSGGAGKPGQAGAGGATHGVGSGACNGGNGGSGAQGGASGGGSGGVSVGILYSSTGSAPTVDSATTGAITVGAAGALGQGGATPTNDGKAGVAQGVLGFP